MLEQDMGDDEFWEKGGGGVELMDFLLAWLDSWMDWLLQA